MGSAELITKGIRGLMLAVVFIDEGDVEEAYEGERADLMAEIEAAKKRLAMAQPKAPVAA